jgi:hypothetical protein
MFKRKEEPKEVVLDNTNVERDEAEVIVAKEEPKEESKEESKEEPKEEEQVVGYPVFVTEADINRMIYENNQMLRQLLQIVQKE